MPEMIEVHLQKLLKGLPLDTEEAEICDFSLEEQNEALESQGIQPTVDPKYTPVVGETVVYIVACVLVNDHNEVLMMQEAKTSCAGKWYLPAGRLEKGEDIVTAGKREVLEETGLEIECTTLLMVETARGNWMRFVLTGKVTGGSLKTPAQADKESLQAKWVLKLEELELRGNDIMHLIEKARSYHLARKTKDHTWFVDQLPALRAYSKQLMRLVIVIKKKATNKMHVLVSEKTTRHLPVCEIHPTKSVHSTLMRFMIDIFGAGVPQHKPYGILSVEFDPGSGKDGLCLTVLVGFKDALEDVPIIGKCVWSEISKEMSDNLLARISSKNATFSLHVIK